MNLHQSVLGLLAIPALLTGQTFTLGGTVQRVSGSPTAAACPCRVGDRFAVSVDLGPMAPGCSSGIGGECYRSTVMAPYTARIGGVTVDPIGEPFPHYPQLVVFDNFANGFPPRFIDEILILLRGAVGAQVIDIGIFVDGPTTWFAGSGKPGTPPPEVLSSFVSFSLLSDNNSCNADARLDAPKCLRPPNATLKVRYLDFKKLMPRCGLFARGEVNVAKFSDGSRLDLACDGPVTGPIGYKLWYRDVGGRRNRIGQCLFHGGCNMAHYMTWGDNDGDGLDDCLISSEWTNIDGALNDSEVFTIDGTRYTTPEEPYIDVLRYNFDTATNKLSWINEKYDYPSIVKFVSCDDPENLKGGLVPGLGKFVDPFVGTLTEAAFDATFQWFVGTSADPGETMDGVAACDLNRSGTCDFLDQSIAQAAINICRTDSRYTLAISEIDVDRDGCISTDDVQAWLRGFPAVVDSTPPTIVPHLNGVQGQNGWYRSDVSLSWSVSDSESSVTSSTGCVASTLKADSAGTTLTCSAQNSVGLTNSVSVTIKIDKTSPSITGLPPAACTLWPPDLKLVTVGTVTGADALSGLAANSFKVTGASNEPIKSMNPAIVITPSASGGFVIQLQAERLGTGTGRVYTLTATAADVAGNTATATATCTVPLDQGK